MFGVSDNQIIIWNEQITVKKQKTVFKFIQTKILHLTDGSCNHIHYDNKDSCDGDNLSLESLFEFCLSNTVLCSIQN